MPRDETALSGRHSSPTLLSSPVRLPRSSRLDGNRRRKSRARRGAAPGIDIEFARGSW